MEKLLWFVLFSSENGKETLAAKWQEDMTGLGTGVDRRQEFAEVWKDFTQFGFVGC